MRTFRNLALGAAGLLFAVAPLWFPDGPARAGDITYPGLTSQSTVIDTDLLAAWRATGPLAKINASTLEAYIQGKLITGTGSGPIFLQPSLNLSDLGNIGTARTNLGLGSAALANTGTSGTALCQLNSNCTWTGTEAFNAGITAQPAGTGPSVDASTPNSGGTTGGIRLRGNAATGNAFEQITNSAAGTEWGHWTYVSSGAATWTGSLAASSFSGPLTGNVTGNVSGNATTATTATNATQLGGVPASGWVQNNGSTYSINITGSAGSASTANTANSATTASSANALAGLVTSLSTNGVVEIPGSGGTIYIEWGLYDTGCGTCWNTASAVSLSFPVSFPHGALNVVATTYNPAGIANPRIATVYGPSSTGFFLVGNGGNSPEGAYWIAIGY